MNETPKDLPLGIYRDQWGYIRCSQCDRCEYRDGHLSQDGMRRTARGLSVVNLVSQIEKMEHALRDIERDVSIFSVRSIRRLARETLTSVGMCRARDHGDVARFNEALGRWAGDPNFYDLDLYARKPYVMDETLI